MLAGWRNGERMMSMEYIRKAYDVPAKRGGRVEYTGEGTPEHGTITGADGHYLRVRMDGTKYAGNYHPTWRMAYLKTANVEVRGPEAALSPEAPSRLEG